MKEYDFAISEKDETVPKDYIGIAKIFTDSRYALPSCNKETWCIGNRQLNKMRRETFKAVKQRYDLCRSEDFARFWNGNLDAINDLGLNRFANLTFFKEIATAMICFQTTIENKRTGTKRKTISWGIKDSIYRAYYKAQRDALADGSEPKRVSLYDSRKVSSGNVFKLPSERILFDCEDGRQQIIKVKRNALFNKFEFWCKAKGVTKQEGIYQAIELALATYPVTELKELGAYERKCDLDYVEVLIPDTSQDGYSRIIAKIPVNIHKKMHKIIQRYNKDLDNSTEPRMTVPKYVAQAIDLLNNKTSLKYRDPEAYDELQKIKRASEYNNKIINEK